MVDLTCLVSEYVKVLVVLPSCRSSVSEDLLMSFLQSRMSWRQGSLANLVAKIRFTALSRSLEIMHGLHVLSKLRVSPLIAVNSAMRALLQWMERRDAPIQISKLSLPTAAKPIKPILEQKEALTFTFVIPG